MCCVVRREDVCRMSEFDAVLIVKNARNATTIIGAVVVVRLLIHPLSHLPCLRYWFMCLFYTIPIPNIFFYKRETKYLTFPVFLEGHF